MSDNATSFTVPEHVRLLEEVEIGMAGSRPMHASIAVPAAAPDAPMPVMVYIHGGGWNHGTRRDSLSAICDYVTKRGYIGVTLDYRLTPEASFPAQIHDVKLAIRYLRAHVDTYHLDPSRIGVWGSSAGGHLASLLGTTGDLTPGRPIRLEDGSESLTLDLEGDGGWPQYSSKVQAVADWFGPNHFMNDFAHNSKSIRALLGGSSVYEVPQLAQLAMPGTYASPDTPPFWIRHGEADTVVPIEGSELFAQRLQAARVPVVDYARVPEQGHGFTGDALAQAREEAWAFMDRYVKNKPVTEPIVFRSK
jgi:acetyl esterase/lipase